MGLAGTRPYFIRAVNEWLLDRGMTPYLLVDATWPAVEVPAAFVEEGRIVLNIRPSAVRDLTLGNEFISFSARFTGVTHAIFVPVGAVLGIYARENGEGLFFEADEYPRDAGQTPPEPPAGGSEGGGSAGVSRQRPGLRLVK